MCIYVLKTYISYTELQIQLYLIFLFRLILEREGARSLFRGLGPNLVGVAPSRYEQQLCSIWVYSFVLNVQYYCTVRTDLAVLKTGCLLYTQQHALFKVL